jgi:hypothetical protein
MKNRNETSGPSEFVYTKRARRQDASGAMRGEIVIGLVEAITNADDAYGDAPGKILIKVSSKDADGHWTVSVSDRACGISSADVSKKLIAQGERTSGYEKGEKKRGNRGRGAKDLAIFGGVRFESACGKDAIVLAADRNGHFIERSEKRVSDEFRKSIGVTKNGTRVTITCRKNIVRKQFDTLKRELQTAVALRPILENPHRTIILSYPEREETIRFVAPKIIETVFDGTVDVHGYGSAQVRLYVASEPFSEGTDVDGLGGLIIKGEYACHERTLFGAENHPYANRLFGSLRFDAIDVLTRELDDLEERDEDPPDSNPFPIISRIRNGLEKTHPAYKALKKAVRPIIDDYLKKAADSASANVHETSETRRRNELMARELVKWTIEQEQEMETLLDDPGVPRPPFEVIPTKRVLEHGQSASFTIRARTDIVVGKLATVEFETDEDPAGALSEIPRTINLPVPAVDADFSEAHLKVTAGKITGSALISAKLVVDGQPSGHSAEVVVSVVDPVEVAPIEPPAEFQFASREYSVAPGKTRRLLLSAPAHIVQRMGTDIILSCSDQNAVVLHGYRLQLELVQEGWYEADVTVEGLQHGGEAIVKATTPEKAFHASAKVTVRDTKGPRLEIHIVDLPGPRRASWDESKELITVRVNATHPAARRYFGEPQKFRLQHTLPARMMIAEAVADAAVQHILSKEAEKRPAGALDVDELQANRLRKLQGLLPRLHRTQISDEEWARDAQTRELEAVAHASV